MACQISESAGNVQRALGGRALAVSPPLMSFQRGLMHMTEYLQTPILVRFRIYSVLYISVQLRLRRDKHKATCGNREIQETIGYREVDSADHNDTDNHAKLNASPCFLPFDIAVGVRPRLILVGS